MSTWSTELHDGVAVATFHRPPRNLMSMAAMSELEQVLTDLAADDDVKVVVLTGGVDGYFVAHADLDDLTSFGRGEDVAGDPASWVRVMQLLSDMPQPVVAAINGQAWGGGCELALACTIRWAAASAHFSQPEVAVGIIPGSGGTQRLPRLIGAGRAADLILTGSVVEADEAERIGLVSKVLPDEGFRDAVVAEADRIARHPAHATRAAKRAILDGLELSLVDGLRLEGRLFIESQMRPDTVSLQERVADAERVAPPDERFYLD
jgi:enoyl-CoA hydratase/carnithine racemase